MQMHVIMDNHKDGIAGFYYTSHFATMNNTVNAFSRAAAQGILITSFSLVFLFVLIPCLGEIQWNHCNHDPNGGQLRILPFYLY
jgi:hypothetical protein